MTRRISLATKAMCLTAGDTLSWIQGHGYITATITDIATQPGPGGQSAVMLWTDGNRNDGRQCDLVVSGSAEVWIADPAEAAALRSELDALRFERDVLIERLDHLGDDCDCGCCDDYQERPIEDVLVAGGRL